MFLKNNYLPIFAICVLTLNQLPTVLPQVQSRIVGGEVTTINKVPYLVQLLDNGQFFCGGTLISQRHVLTAAHCVKGMAARRLTIVAGTGKLSQQGVRSNVIKIMVPKGFNAKSMHMDVAVLKLQSPLSGRFISPIGLCTKGWNAGAMIKVSGWGLTAENAHSVPNQVHTVNVRSIAKAKCAEMYRRNTSLTKTMFCASVPGRKDSCSGDSGGPAIIDGQVCGIVSWGIGCARAAFPGVYTNVNIVKTFIRNAMQK